jgi:transposase-like protein
MRPHSAAAFKARVEREILREGKPIASAHGGHPSVLHSWKAPALGRLPRLFEGRDDGAALRQEHEREKHELYAAIGRLATQVVWRKRKAGLGHDQG